MLKSHEEEYISSFSYKEGDEVVVQQRAFEETDVPRRGFVCSCPWEPLGTEVPVKLYNPPTQATNRVFKKLFVKKINPAKLR